MAEAKTSRQTMEELYNKILDDIMSVGETLTPSEVYGVLETVKQHIVSMVEVKKSAPKIGG